MPFVSYAQFKEDIYLLRALKDVRHDEDFGFYIDVGANDPEIDSVTKLFYDHGWRGVNIEPSPKWYARLQEQRPRDVNIQSVVSNENRQFVFYDHTDGGLGTIVDRIAERNEQMHNIAKKPLNIDSISLTEICERYAPKEIHFLKIDVEGSERGVLLSADFKKFRPWVLCIEAFEPLSDVPTHGEWEPLLFENGYHFCLADHANRFYLANEHAHRSSAFSMPLDEYVLARDVQRTRELEERLRRLEAKLSEIENVIAR